MGAYRGAVFCLLLVAAAVGATPGESPIQLPKPAAVPAPMPVPGAVLLLTSDQLYVINSKVDASVRAHPRGLVKVEKKKGPRDFSAKFVDGLGLIEDREYAGPFIFVVKAAGKGRVELDVVPYGFKSDDEIVSTVFDVDAGGSTPDVDPNPPPKPKPDPVVVEKVSWVIVIEEKSSRTPAIAVILADTNYWTGLGAKGYNWRIYDKDSPSLDGKNYLDYPGPVDAAGNPTKIKYADKVGLPYVLFLDNTGKKLNAVKLPAKTTDIDALIAGGGK